MSAPTAFLSILRSPVGLESSRTIGNSAVGVVFAFGCGVVSAHMLGPHDRGSLALLVTTVGLCGFVSSLGTSVALRVGLMRDPRIQIRSFVEVSAVLAVLQALIVAVAVVALGKVVGFDHQRTGPLLGAAVVLGVICFASQQMLDTYHALGWPSRAAALNSAGTIATLLALVVAWRGGFGLLGAIGAYAGGFGVILAGGGLLYRSHAGFAPVADPRLRDRGLLIRSGFPLLAINLGQALAFKLDHYFVGAAAGVSATGIYSVAAAHVAPSQVATFAIGQVAFREAAQDKLPDRKLVLMVLASMAVALVCAVALFALTPWFVPVVFGAAFAGSVPIIRVLMVGQILLAPYLVLSRAFTGRGLSWISSGSSVVFLGLLALLLALLTPSYGALGAAWATVIAAALSSLMLAALLRTRASRPPR